MAEVTVTTLGIRGGVAVSPDGMLELAVPAEALTQDTELTIAIDRATLDGPLASPIYVVGPQDLAFARDVELRIRVTSIPADEELDIADLGGAQARLLDAILDDTSSILRSPVRSASSYAARRRPNRCSGLACGADCTTGPIPRACNLAGRCVPTFVPLGCGMSDGGPGPSVDGGPGPSGDGGPFPGFDGGPPPSGDGGPSGGPFVEQEPNDTPATANLVPALVTIQAAIGPGGDVDYFAIDIPSSGQLVAYTYTGAPVQPPQCVGIDTVLAVLDQSNNTVMENDDVSGIGCSRVDGPLVGPGRYYLRVTSFVRVTQAAAYLLEVQFTPTSGLDGGPGPGPLDAGPGPIDAGSVADGGVFTPDAGLVADGGVFTPDAGAIVNGVESEPNNSIATSNLLAPVSTVMAMISPSGDEDYFAFDALGPVMVTAYTYTQNGAPTVCSGIDTTLELYGSGGGAPIAANDDQSSQTRCSRVQATVSAGRYYLRVQTFGGLASTTPYYLDVVAQ